MKEKDFISNRSASWESFEKEQSQKDSDPNRLSELFIELSDDLAYSQTHYKNRAVKQYLNNLGQRVYLDLYKNKKPQKNFLIEFLFNEVPALIYHARKQMLWALAIFMISIAIGVVSSIHDPEFARQILSDRYVEMTEEFIEEGDPMAVYKQSSEISMTVGITINNIFVSTLTFLSGIIAGLGSVISLIRNGVMLGVFQFFFIERGIYAESILGIWQHGTIEISAIILSGGAGLVLGQGLLFPGRYSRLVAFRNTARRGLKIFIAILPLFVIAGFIEGFITRLTDLPDIIRISSILISLSLILGYYVALPYLTTKEDREKYKVDSEEDFIDESTDIELSKIRSANQLMIDTFRALFKVSKPILINASLIALGAGIATYFMNNWFGNAILLNAKSLANADEYRFLYLFNGVIVGTSLFFISRAVFKLLDIKQPPKKNPLLQFINYQLLGVSFALTFIFDGGWFVAFLILNIAIWGYASVAIRLERANPFHAIGQGVIQFNIHLNKSVGYWLSAGLLVFIFTTLAGGTLFGFYSVIITWNLPFEMETVIIIMRSVNVAFGVFVSCLLIGLLQVCSTFIYFSLNEIKSATKLLSEVESMGQVTFFKGIRRE